MLSIGVVNYNSLPFVDMLLQSIRKTISRNRRFHFYVCDNGSSSQEVYKLTRFAKKRKIKLFFRQQSNEVTPSYSHADSINFLIGKMRKNSTHIMVVDADCFFVKCNWDLTLDRLLETASFLCTNSKYRLDLAGPFVYYGHAKYTYRIRKKFYPSIKHDGKLETSKRDTGYLLSFVEGWMKLPHISPPKPFMGSETYDICFPNNELFAVHFSRGWLRGEDAEKYNQWITGCQRMLGE